jgi:hypothetical protein
MKLTRDTAAALMAVAAICIVVGLGFWKTRGPGSQRLIRADEKRIQSIGQLAGQINNYYGEHNKQLPATLSEEQKLTFKDPLTGRPAEYAPSTGSKFALCTDFSAPSPEDYKDAPFDFWRHPQGHKCFEFEAAGTIPQVPYFYF